MADEAERVSQQKNEASGPASHSIVTPNGIWQMQDITWEGMFVWDAADVTEDNIKAAQNYIKTRYIIGTTVHERVEQLIAYGVKVNASYMENEDKSERS